jgi:hypothetical protein
MCSSPAPADRRPPLTGVEFYERLGYHRVSYLTHRSGATYAMVKALD